MATDFPTESCVVPRNVRAVRLQMSPSCARHAGAGRSRDSEVVRPSHRGVEPPSTPLGLFKHRGAVLVLEPVEYAGLGQAGASFLCVLD